MILAKIEDFLDHFLQVSNVFNSMGMTIICISVSPYPVDLHRYPFFSVQQDNIVVALDYEGKCLHFVGIEDEGAYSFYLLMSVETPSITSNERRYADFKSEPVSLKWIGDKKKAYSVNKPLIEAAVKKLME